MVWYPVQFVGLHVSGFDETKQTECKGLPFVCEREAGQCHIARRVCYLVHYVEQKGAFWCLENPLSSLLWLYKPVADMLRRPGVHCVSVALGQYG